MKYLAHLSLRSPAGIPLFAPVMALNDDLHARPGDI
jgi:hypothetical protein